MFLAVVPYRSGALKIRGCSVMYRAAVRSGYYFFASGSSGVCSIGDSNGLGIRTDNQTDGR